jgi:hypothetical protein
MGSLLPLIALNRTTTDKVLASPLTENVQVTAEAQKPDEASKLQRGEINPSAGVSFHVVCRRL